MDYLLKCIDPKDRPLVEALVKFHITAERAKARSENLKREVRLATVDELQQQMARLVMVALGMPKPDTINTLREFADIPCPPSPAEATDAELGRWMTKNSEQVAQWDQLLSQFQQPPNQPGGKYFRSSIGKRTGFNLDI